MTLRTAALVLTAATLLAPLTHADEGAASPKPERSKAGGPAKATPKVVYELPYRGAHRVSQASDGATHKGKARHAIDFSMPRGTVVLAARDGLVEKVVEHHREKSKLEKKLKVGKNAPNSVRIRHADGSSAVYLHLQHEGVLVKVGQKVRAGEAIARSGNTGKSSGPHLHFCVFSASEGGRKGRSVLVRFRTDKGPSERLEKGRRYRSPKP
jgi:murein DD-endopeptidase MepM/ murein hydrolase activator NlpD